MRRRRRAAAAAPPSRRPARLDEPEPRREHEQHADQLERDRPEAVDAQALAEQERGERRDEKHLQQDAERRVMARAGNETARPGLGFGAHACAGGPRNNGRDSVPDVGVARYRCHTPCHR